MSLLAWVVFATFPRRYQPRFRGRNHYRQRHREVASAARRRVDHRRPSGSALSHAPMANRVSFCACGNVPPAIGDVLSGKKPFLRTPVNQGAEQAFSMMVSPAPGVVFLYRFDRCCPGRSRRAKAVTRNPRRKNHPMPLDCPLPCSAQVQPDDVFAAVVEEAPPAPEPP